MQVTKIDTVPVRLKKKPERAIRTSKTFNPESTFLLVKVHTDEGIVGLGEVTCDPVWSGEDAHTAAHFIRTIVEPCLVGEDLSLIHI